MNNENLNFQMRNQQQNCRFPPQNMNLGVQRNWHSGKNKANIMRKGVNLGMDNNQHLNIATKQGSAGPEQSIPPISKDNQSTKFATEDWFAYIDKNKSLKSSDKEK